jgi:hypothetical protein
MKSAKFSQKKKKKIMIKLILEVILKISHRYRGFAGLRRRLQLMLQNARGGATNPAANFLQIALQVAIPKHQELPINLAPQG